MTARLPFVLAATDQGTLIVNRFDYQNDDKAGFTYGVGFDLLNSANFEPCERDMVAKLLELRRREFGDGVLALDVGANIGSHTVAWARTMYGWGRILSFEPQEWVYYALAGNIAINNCLNARALNVAVGEKDGMIDVPALSPAISRNFGGVELKSPVDADVRPIPLITLDSLNLPRVDLIKIDIEGMEINALHGAAELIKSNKPILFIEWIKSDQQELVSLLDAFGYNKINIIGMNLLAIHPDDLCREHVSFN